MFALRGDSDNTRKCCAESILFYAHAQEPAADDPGARYLGPMAVFEGRAFADPDIIPDAMLDYFGERVERTKNPYLRARYADLLWQRGRGHVCARESIAAHLQLVNREADEGRYHTAADSARRALALASALGDRGLRASTVDTVTAAAEDWVKKGSDERCFATQIIDKILSGPRFRDQSTLKRWMRLLEEALLIATEHRTRREVLSQLAKVLDRNGRHDEARQRRVDIGAEWEAEAQEREPRSALAAASFRQNALKAYAQAGASEKVEELKQMVRQGYERAAEKEFGTISHTFEIDFTEWDERVAGWFELPATESLMHMAADFWLMPTWEEAEKIAADLMHEAPLSQLIPMTRLDDGRPISQPRTEQEQQLDNVRRQYHWQLVFRRIYLTRALGLLRGRGHLNADSLVLSIQHSPVFDDEKMPMIRCGLDRYASGDFVSALHILVPHLEDCLRKFLARLGGSVTSMTGDKMREKSLDQILAADEMKAALATIAPLHRYLEHALVDETGLNLRNRVAHGLLSEDQCGADNANTVVHIYLLLGLLRAKDSESE